MESVTRHAVADRPARMYCMDRREGVLYWNGKEEQT